MKSVVRTLNEFIRHAGCFNSPANFIDPSGMAEMNAGAGRLHLPYPFGGTTIWDVMAAQRKFVVYGPEGRPCVYAGSNGFGLASDETGSGGGTNQPVKTNAAEKPQLEFQWAPAREARVTDRGAIEITGSWKLKGATAGTQGWVIQRVLAVIHVADCTGKVICHQEKGYYEAWQVVDGTVYAGKHTSGQPNDPGEDRFWNDDQGAGTTGWLKVVARAAFVPNYNLTSPPWAFRNQPGHQRLADDLPTMNYQTDQRPQGFDPTEAIVHQLDFSWSASKTTLRTVPALTEQ